MERSALNSLSIEIIYDTILGKIIFTRQCCYLKLSFKKTASVKNTFSKQSFVGSVFKVPEVPNYCTL